MTPLLNLQLRSYVETTTSSNQQRQQLGHALFEAHFFQLGLPDLHVALSFWQGQTRSRLQEPMTAAFSLWRHTQRLEGQ